MATTDICTLENLLLGIIAGAREAGSLRRLRIMLAPRSTLAGMNDGIQTISSPDSGFFIFPVMPQAPQSPASPLQDIERGF